MNDTSNTPPPPAAQTWLADSSEAAEKKRMSPAERAKVSSWQLQHQALGAPHYRITLAPRREYLRPRNYGNEGHRKLGVPENFWSAIGVASRVSELTALNKTGYDIYVTPIDDQHHYVVIDDVRSVKLTALQEAGYGPCLIQLSSADNYQAILKIMKYGVPNEQQIANQLVVTLNERYGDPKFSGVVHPFRACGYANRKPGRHNTFAKVILARPGPCQLLSRTFKDMVSAYEQSGTRAMLDKVERRRLSRPEGAPFVDSASPEAVSNAFARARLKVISWVISRRLPRDDSKIDFRAAVSLLSDGWAQSEVELAIRSSPDVDLRHSDSEGYAARTVRAAARQVASKALFSAA
jgi:hypothetical protein